MLTSYLVKCPHADCDWFGSLLPQTDAEAGRALPRSVVAFQCPRCEGDWQARVVGDDVVFLQLAELSALPG